MAMNDDELEVGTEGDYIPSVTDVQALDNYKLRVTLSDGRKGIFSMSPYLDKGNLRELKDPRYFRRVFIDNDTVTWPHGQDIDPELIEEKLQPDPERAPSWAADNKRK